jgi:hypothetical protein
LWDVNAVSEDEDVYAVSNEGCVMNNELERIRKYGVVTYFSILYQHLAVGTEENHEESETRYAAPRPRLEPVYLPNISRKSAP